MLIRNIATKYFITEYRAATPMKNNVTLICLFDPKNTQSQNNNKINVFQSFLLFNKFLLDLEIDKFLLPVFITFGVYQCRPESIRIAKNTKTYNDLNRSDFLTISSLT